MSVKVIFEIGRIEEKGTVKSFDLASILKNKETLRLFFGRGDSLKEPQIFTL